MKTRAASLASQTYLAFLLVHLSVAFVVLFASGCATPVGVKHLDEQAAHRELNANVLSTGKPSDYSTQLLERSALTERFKTDPSALKKV